MHKLIVSKTELAHLIGRARVHQRLRISCHGDTVVVRGRTFAYMAQVADTHLPSSWDNL